jgi:hypothetical protein
VTFASSSSIERLLGRVLSHPKLPPAIQDDLERWDAAVGRGEGATVLDAWADRIADAIDALDTAPSSVVIGVRRSSAPPSANAP